MNSSQQTSLTADGFTEQCRRTLDELRAELIAEQNEQGHWSGELSPSALSTATAISAMSAVILRGDQARQDIQALAEFVRRGIAYLSKQQNPDGGFGDTDRSHSNIATSYLVLSASHLAQQAVGGGLPDDQLARLQKATESFGGIAGLRARYGTDKTFVVPILCNMAIAGLVDWGEVAALPFEAAVFPQSMYRFLQMPVVSYAVPALVAIGQARHFLGPKTLAPLRAIRAASVKRTMRVLKRMQPESGGYLEATPLTAFVVMSLAATGRGDCDVARSGLQFLRASMADEGSWPIDTNLATWVTSLSVSALSADPHDDGSWFSNSLLNWHLDCQHKRRHPFTGAEPGGWGWTDLSGAVPDSDDTPAAILALSQMTRHCDGADLDRIETARMMGGDWLQRLQNRNGGWPTFCRGWGKLPFDRSSTDLTAHALRAFASLRTARSNQSGIEKGHQFLKQNQRADGSWLPLWFGNQDNTDDENPIYGTSRVLLVRPDEKTWPMHISAIRYLIAAQNPDGGWGGGPSVTAWLQKHGKTGAKSTQNTVSIQSSVEETALAIEALAQTMRFAADEAELDAGLKNRQPESAETAVVADKSSNPAELSLGGETKACAAAIISGIDFLCLATQESRHRVMWPIGFYFAKLWYHERLYPLIYSVGAFGRVLGLSQKLSELESRSPGFET